MSRVVPADGRSRAYLDGRMATVSALGRAGRRLVDLHGQHAHQSLFRPGRSAPPSTPMPAPNGRPRRRPGEVRRTGGGHGGAGGDAAARGRERELLRYQIAELDAAGLQGADEDDGGRRRGAGWARLPPTGPPPRLAHRGPGRRGAGARPLGPGVSATAGHPPLAALHERLRGLAAELTDAADEAREAADSCRRIPSAWRRLWPGGRCSRSSGASTPARPAAWRR